MSRSVLLSETASPQHFESTSNESASESSDWPPRLGAPSSSFVPARSRASIRAAGCLAHSVLTMHTPSPRARSKRAELSSAECATSPTIT
eukprot:4496662-Prymnesium_polylepis.1